MPRPTPEYTGPADFVRTYTSTDPSINGKVITGPLPSGNRASERRYSGSTTPGYRSLTNRQKKILRPLSYDLQYKACSGTRAHETDTWFNISNNQSVVRATSSVLVPA